MQIVEVVYRNTASSMFWRQEYISPPVVLLLLHNFPAVSLPAICH